MAPRPATKLRRRPDHDDEEDRHSMATSSGNEDDAEPLDSDEELQLAHAAGKLKSGLQIAVDEERQHINNRGALEAKLSAIKLNLPWLERLDTVNKPAILAPELAQALGVADASNTVGVNVRPYLAAHATTHTVPESAREVNANDDFSRELFLYRQAQAAVLENIPRLKQLGVPTKRPDDYFAEMVKSDEHMQRIRQVLLRKQHETEASEKARKMREMKKRGAQVHQEVQQQRARDKRELIKSVADYRKTGAKSSTMDDLLGDDDADKVGKHNRLRSDRRPKTTNRVAPGAKRQYKNDQFGYGGKQRGSKRNTRDSTDAYASSSRTSFSRSSFATPQQVKRVRHRIQKHGGGGGGKQKRPGKVTRQKMKTQRK